MKRFLIIIMIYSATISLCAQSIIRSDMNLSELVNFNPARTGLNGGSAAVISQNLNNDFIEYSSNYLYINSPILGERLGFGVIAQHESIDFLTSSSFSVNLAYYLQISKNTKASFGLGSEWNHRSIQIPENLYVRDIQDPLFDDLSSNLKGDVNFGIELRHKNLQIGGALYRISGRSSETASLPSAIQSYVQYELPMRNEKDLLQLGALYSSYKNGVSQEVSGFLQYWIFNDINVGYQYHLEGKHTGYLGFIYDDRIHLGYNISSGNSGNDQLIYHSIGIRYLFNEQYFERKQKERFTPIRSVNPEI